MSAAKHDCQPSVDEEKPPAQAPISTLTPAQEKEMRSMGAIKICLNSALRQMPLGGQRCAFLHPTDALARVVRSVFVGC